MSDKKRTFAFETKVKSGKRQASMRIDFVGTNTKVGLKPPHLNKNKTEFHKHAVSKMVSDFIHDLEGLRDEIRVVEDEWPRDSFPDTIDLLGGTNELKIGW